MKYIKKRKFNTGGQIGAGVGATATAMIPVVGPMLAPLGGMVGAELGKMFTPDKKIAKPIDNIGGINVGAKGGTLPLGKGAQKYVGPKHEQGGILVDEEGNPANENQAVAEVEGGETEQDGYIFSDELIVPETDMTFADAHEMLLAEGADESEIQELVALQEQVRASEGVSEAPMGEQPMMEPQMEQPMMEEPSELPMTKGGNLPKYNLGGQTEGQDKSFYWDSQFAPLTGMARMAGKAVQHARGAMNASRANNLRNAQTRGRITPQSRNTVPRPQRPNGTPLQSAQAPAPQTATPAVNTVRGASSPHRAANIPAGQGPSSPAPVPRFPTRETGYTMGRVAKTAAGIGVVGSGMLISNGLDFEEPNQVSSSRALSRDNTPPDTTNSSATSQATTPTNSTTQNNSTTPTTPTTPRMNHTATRTTIPYRRPDIQIDSVNAIPTVEEVSDVQSAQNDRSKRSLNKAIASANNVNKPARTPINPNWRNLGIGLQVGTRLAGAMLPSTPKTPHVSYRPLKAVSPVFANERNRAGAGLNTAIQGGANAQGAYAQYLQAGSQTSAQEAEFKRGVEGQNEQMRQQTERTNVQITAQNNDMKAQERAAKFGLIASALDIPVTTLAADTAAKQSMLQNINMAAANIPDEMERNKFIQNAVAMMNANPNKSIEKILAELRGN